MIRASVSADRAASGATRHGRRHIARIAIAGACLLSATVAAAQAREASRPAAAALPTGQARYYESCGGCHGLNGVSARAQIPVLRTTVGAFLCSDEGRAYIVRLPNVAFAAMTDADLAATMNFVVFELGHGSAPATARPYSAGEVRMLRARPLKNQPLAAMRGRIFGEALQTCPTDRRPALDRYPTSPKQRDPS